MSEVKTVTVGEGENKTEIPIKYLTAPRRKGLNLENAAEVLGFDPIKKLNELMLILSPEDQAKICLDILGYVIPKKKAIEHSGSDDGPPIRVEGTTDAIIERIRSRTV